MQFLHNNAAATAEAAGSTNAPGAPQRRLIRVFLSSTFIDFMEERELLSKRVFPALNRRARERGVELVDVDLRWGVTEAMTRNGRTLPICLAAIDRCRPYFIGLLGGASISELESAGFDACPWIVATIAKSARRS